MPDAAPRAKICEPNARPSNASEPATTGSTPTRARATPSPTPTPTPSAARVTASKGPRLLEPGDPPGHRIRTEAREGSSDRELSSSGPPDSLDGTVAHPPDTTDHDHEGWTSVLLGHLRRAASTGHRAGSDPIPDPVIRRQADAQRWRGSTRFRGRPIRVRERGRACRSRTPQNRGQDEQ